MNGLNPHLPYQPAVIWEGRPSLWQFSSLLLAGLLLLPFWGFGLVVIAWALIKRSTIEYLVLTGKVYIRVGLLAKSSRELRIVDIRSINIARRGFGGLFGVGDVEFSSAASDAASVTFWGISGAEAVADLVRAVQDGRMPPQVTSSSPARRPINFNVSPMMLTGGCIGIPILFVIVLVTLSAIREPWSRRQTSLLDPTPTITPSATARAVVATHTNPSIAPLSAGVTPTPTVRAALSAASAASPASPTPIPSASPKQSPSPKTLDPGPPKYATFRTWNTADLLGGVVIVSSKDVTEIKLTALAQSLREKYKPYRRIMIQAFTDKRAAIIRDKNMAEQTHADLDFLDAHYVMRYFKNDYQSIDEVEIMTKGAGGPFKTVKLNE